MTGPSERNPRDMMTGIECVGEGWRPLIRDLEGKLLAHDPDYTLSQVKEKFGGLRYYAHTEVVDVGVSMAENPFYRAIDEAEKKSLTICESCGTTENVSTKGAGWVKTLCDSCRGV